MKPKKPFFTILFLFLIVSTAWFYLKPKQEIVTAETVQDIDSYLDLIANNLQGGGPPKDGIPAIDEGVYISKEEVDFLEDTDKVFGINYNGHSVAYPQKVMYWHEIVNSEVKGEKISITYCPLTGSVIGYVGKNLGISGKLYNSNLVMYDRETDSNIPQILGVGINGELRGKTLETFPVIVTTWKAWKDKYPNTQVLSLNTGYDRDYDQSPYPGYEDALRVWFPVAVESDKFHSKELVVGVEINDKYYAFPKKIKKDVEIENVKFTYDKDLDVFTTNEDVKYFESYWFAWYAYHPDTLIIE